jgi:hypothetical protein
MNSQIEELCIKLQPYYDDLISKYSKSYLSGSIYYVGDNLLEWWQKANNIRYYEENKKKLETIIEIIEINLKK